MKVIKSYTFSSPALLLEPYSADLNFPALSILSRRVSHASVWLVNLILRSSRCSDLSCPQNPIRGRKVYISHLLSFILCGGSLIQGLRIKVLIIKVHISKFCLSRFTHLILCYRPKSILQTISFFLSISHIGESHLLKRFYLPYFWYFI